MKRIKWMPVIGAVALMSLVTVFSYVGCGGSSSSSSGSSGDTTAPTVASKGPVANATNVALNAVITATFSEAMDPDTISSTTFTLCDYEADETIAGTVIYDENSKTATLTSTADLELARLYQARISVSVKDLAGNAISGGMFYYSWTFHTRDGAWGTDLRIDINDGANDTACPHVTMGPNGNGIAVWAQVTNTAYSILASRYVSGTGWTVPELLETDDAGMALNPKVAMDSFGNAIAVWEQVTNTKTSILANYYEAGIGWGSAEVIEDDDDADAAVPQVAMDPAGNAIVVWEQVTGSMTSILAARYVSPTGWTDAVILEANDTYDANAPQIAIDPLGNAMVVWHQANGSWTSIMANHYDVAADDWDGPVLIEDGPENAVKPQVAIDPWGDAMAVWEHSGGTYYNIYANRYVSGTGWAASAVLLETNDTGDATVPQIAIDTQGFAIAVWQHYDLISGYRSIYTAYYNCEGNTWGAPELLETTNYNAYGPLIAFDQDQNAIAIWRQSDGVQDNIYSNRYLHCANAWGTAGLAEATDGDIRNQYALACDTLGNAIAIWRHWGVSVDIIRANRFVFE